MPTFAIVSEGKTDQVVLEAIIQEFYGSQFEDDIDINFLQPIRDATDAKTASHGGWKLVFEYCQHRMLDAVATNDFVVIHVDTDCGEDEGFGLALTEEGRDRPVSDILREAVEILQSKIDDAVVRANADRILYAVAVHSTECWLLLILYDIEREKNCENRLVRELRRSTGKGLNKEVKPYRNLSRSIKRRRLLELVDIRHSLGDFLLQLRSLQVSDAEDAAPSTEVEG